jgi:predicted transcriptional regulator
MNEEAEKKKKELFKELLVDDQKPLEILIKRIKKILRLTKSGKPIFIIPYYNLSDTEKLAIHLIVQYIIKELGISNKDSMDVAELAKKAGVKYKTATARLSEMYQEGIVDKTSSGEYYITYVGIEIVIERLEKKFAGEKDENSKNSL